MKSLPVFSCLLLLGFFLHAQPGTIDTGFGTKGVSYFNEPFIHNAVIEQPDGKLVTAGQYAYTGSFYPSGSLMRFLPDGKMDSSFGSNGITDYPVGSKAYNLILQTDKTILAVGTTTIANVERAYVARYKFKGTLDSAFGVNGVALVPDYNDISHYDQIKLEPDGSIVIAGSGKNNPYHANDAYMMLSHVSAGGVFDTAFGKNGRLQERFPDYNGVEEKALAIQKDGKILLGGYVVNGGIEDQKLVISRYRTNGTLDNTFGGTGVITTQGVAGANGQNDMAGIIVQADRKIVIGCTAAGAAAGTGYGVYMAALRYNPDGTTDNTFGNGGRALVSFKPVTPYTTAILQQPDGKFVLTGSVTINQMQYRDVALCRITSDGSLDSSFGINGKQTTDFSDFDYPTCAALQRDGKIVLGGSYQNNKQNYESYSLIRYYGSKEPLFVTTSNRVRIAPISSIPSSLHIYPNPARDYLMVIGLTASNETTIALIDDLGKTIAVYTIGNAAQYRIDVSKLTAGVYYVQVNNINKAVMLRFVKE